MKNVVILLLLWGITIVACKNDSRHKHKATRQTTENKPRIRKNATGIVQANRQGLHPLFYLLKNEDRQQTPAGDAA